ncbi:hypothetical protein [Nonomuraea sp. bgisy101]|uniref:hypothetical protein n=1 Tax=Nonomuraea sp. bgisy101 TaxID=3413784 RepID=UPI003D7257BD
MTSAVSSHSFKSGEGTWVTCHTYSNRSPILALYMGSLNVSFCPGSSAEVTDADLSFAKELARSAAAYLAACESFHAKQA